MGNRDLDEMIEQYKREMLNLSKKGKPPAPEQEVQKVSEVPKKEEKQNCAEKAQPEETQEQQVYCEAAEMLQNMNKSCASQEGEADKTCADLHEFLEENSEKGSMSVDVYAWDSEFGVNSAKVIVMAPLKSGNVICFNGYTDVNGKTGPFELPAPPKDYSLTKGGSAARFAAYTVLVEHPGYHRALFTNVPVFPGVQSVQPVNLFADVAGTQNNGSADSEIPEPEL